MSSRISAVNILRSPKAVRSLLAGSYSIIDVATGKIQRQYSFHEEVPLQRSVTIMGEGDERALSRNIKR